MKATSLRALSIALILCLLTASSTFALADAAPAAGVAQEAQADQAVRLQDDFYAAVNAVWLAATEIPANKMMVGGFDDLSDGVEAQLMADFAAMTPEKAAEIEALPEFLKLYSIAADYETRNARGAEPLKPYLDRIAAIQSLADLSAALPELVLSGLPAPLSLFTLADMGDAQQTALYAGTPTIFLPDNSYYGTPTGDYLFGVLKPILVQLMQAVGQSEEQATECVEQALAFDALLAPNVLSAAESADYTGLYNPVALDAFCESSTALDLRATLTALLPALPERVVVIAPKYYAALNELVSEANFPALQSWMQVQMVYAAAPLLSQEMADTAATFSMMMTGQTEHDDPQKLAYRQAASLYAEPVGLYYGRTYFGEDAKRDVTAMVQAMVQVFKQRLLANDWLGAETIEAAVRKLDRMTCQIGYPDKIDPLYAQMLITPADQGGSLLSNSMNLRRQIMADLFSKCGQPTQPEYWELGADTVNAIYSPQKNTITFPAAILQAPFYSLEQSASRNFGGIGAVIAHEITHAFDNNGAAFDEYGNLRNWWSEADTAAFEERTQAMVAQFEGVPFAGGVVSGQLTVGENIADAGGLSCALESAKALADYNPQEFFENWAIIWRMKATPQIEQLLLTLDVHAPNKLRANIQLQNLEAFYEAFGITESDAMYLAPEKRISIW